MLYLFYGNDGEKVRNRATKLWNASLVKEVGATPFRFDAESFAKEKIQELASGQSLFDAEAVVEARFVLADAQAKEWVGKLLSEMVASASIFIFREADVDKKTVTLFEKAGAHIEECSVSLKKQSGFNMFSLVDALGSRDKKMLWVLYQKALEHNATPEEIHGLLFWQLKALLLAESVKGDKDGATKTALNPFVFKKAAANLRHFKEGELAHLSSKMITLYHESRRGGAPLEVALERFVLAL